MEETAKATDQARHYSTIGIGNVFIDRPLGSEELVGNIKSIPEDFVVREIAKHGDQLRVADSKSCAAWSSEELAVPKASADSASVSVDAKLDHTPEDHDSLEPTATTNTAEELLRSLNLEDSSYWDALDRLQHQVLDEICQTASENSSSEELILTLPYSSAVAATDKKLDAKEEKQERAAVHDTIRLFFCLLRAEQLEKDATSWKIRITLDDQFHELAQYLADPRTDLPLLYDFFKKGYDFAAASKASESSAASGKKRRRDNNSRQAAISGPTLRLKRDLPREERRPVHNTIDTKSKGMLGTSTIKSGEDCAIGVHWTKTAERRCRKRKRSGENPQPQEYTLCVVKKRQRENLEMIQALCTTIRCRLADVGLAGIKDKNAVTYQFCTLPFPAKRINAAALEGRGVEVTPFATTNKPLQRGQLIGNRFSLVVRNIRRIQLLSTVAGKVCEKVAPATDTVVRTMVDRLSKGFVNFYGEQRLGDPGLASVVGTRTFEIGRAMLQQDYTKAINLLMAGRKLINGVAQRDEDVPAFRKAWKDSGGDPVRTAKAMHVADSSAPRERAVLKGLKRYGINNPREAFKCIPYNERIFYINSYQSFVWNQMATARLQKYGNAVVPGDLTMREGSHEVSLVPETPVASDQTRIEDVVLPMPGYGVQYPQNEIGTLYQSTLERDGVALNDKNAPDDSRIKGSYRRLVESVKNLSYEMIKEEEESNGPGAKFSFDLSSGSYATMFLRELMLTTVAREPQQPHGESK